MHILLVCPVPPVPTSGTGTREYNLVRQLSREHEFVLVTTALPEQSPYLEWITPHVAGIFVVPIVPPHSPDGYWERWQHRLAIWKRAFFSLYPEYARTYPQQAIREATLRAVCQHKFDLVHIVGLYGAGVTNHINWVPTIFTAIDVESSKQAMIAACEKRFLRKLQWRLELRKIAHFERTNLEQFDTVLAMSEQDRALLRALAPQSNVHVVPNGVDTAHFRPPEGTDPAGNRIVFFGNLGYFPNVDAITSFCHDVWPTVLNRLPSAQLDIIGPSATKELQDLLHQVKNVKLIGFVDDIRPHLWQATACVVPLRIGGGTRLKILESLAAGCPVISTPLGATGLALEPDKDLLIGENPELFAGQILRIVTTPSLRSLLATNGLQTVTAQYDWSHIAALQSDIYRTVALSGKQPHRL